MIFILTDSDDMSTNHVIDWMHFYELEYVKVCPNVKVEIEWGIDDIYLKIDDKIHPLSSFTGYWYRRGELSLGFEESKIPQINYFLKFETKKLQEYFYYKLTKLKRINSFEKSDVNKLIISDVAKSVGINIPNDYIVSRKKYIDKLDLSSMSTKSLSGYAIQEYESLNSFFYTSLLSDVSQISDFFFPSLIQDYIVKKVELRIFYLVGQFYAMAIFSQEDKTTKVDFRNYNRDIPNRTVPYALNKSIKKKLSLLMNRININCGSIDMIVDQNDKYYFLEVNPIGQFGMVSYPCNYNLEEKIVQYFLNDN